MKTAEEWLQELGPDSAHGANLYRLSSLTIERIQQDAYRAGEQAGMTEDGKAGNDSLRLEAALKEIERQSQMERGIPQAHAVAGCIEAIRRAIYAVDVKLLTARDAKKV